MVVMEGGGEVKRVGEEVDGEMIVRKEGVVDVVDGEMVLVKDGVVELGKQWSNQLGLKIGELFISSEEEGMFYSQFLLIFSFNLTHVSTTRVLIVF